MKILMVLDHNFPPDHRVEKEIETLLKSNHEIGIACYSYNETKELFEEKNDYKIYRKHISKFTYKSSVAALKLPFYFRFWKKFLTDILQKEQIDASL